LITVGFKGGPEIGQAYGKQSRTCYITFVCYFSSSFCGTHIAGFQAHMFGFQS